MSVSSRSASTATEASVAPRYVGAVNARSLAIPTHCVDLPEDLCRAAGAAAVGIDIGQPGQRIVGWVAEPASSDIDWPGCGHVVAKVTLDVRDPDGQYEITLGQPEPDTRPLGLAWCTY